MPVSPEIQPAAQWQNNELTLQNPLFREIWRLEPGGQLRLVSFRRAGGPEWISPRPPPAPGPDDAPICAPADSSTAGTRAWNATFSTRADGLILTAELRLDAPENAPATGNAVILPAGAAPRRPLHRLHTFKLHPLIAGAVHQLTGSETDATLRELEAATGTEKNIQLAGRIRVKPNGQTFITPPAIAHPFFGFYPRHLVVRDIQFVDQTDHHSNLVFEREYLMQSGERCLPLQTNLVCIEDTASREGDGFFWLLMAPLHRVRKRWSAVFDFLLAFQKGALTATACPAGYALARVAYTGGRAGATRALHAFQRAFYTVPPAPARSPETCNPLGYKPDAAGAVAENLAIRNPHGRHVTSSGTAFPPEHSALLLSNTWGDRCGAASLSEKFILDEIAAARALGVEVVQIDDGWQKGATVNTPVAGNQGVWNGFWAADPEFWTVNASRFPRGLAPLVEAADKAVVSLGLWYAPDSTGDLANWEKDAAQILKLWREHRITFFKLDAVKLHSRLAETRFHALCDRVLGESGGAIFFDFDATAEHRPTYWGRPGGGELFLENRFTEEGNYHPHQTLRALWSLAHYIRPKRIRLEFLNPARNEPDYVGDPLRPLAYPPEYLFAITMPGAPLAWFEISRVPAVVIERWRPLIVLWKQHREAFQNGSVFPVGRAPNGFSWTGFVSLAEPDADGPRSLYALLFRELTPDENAVIDLPVLLELPKPGRAQKLAGEGAVTIGEGKLIAYIPAAQHFLFARWEM
ncbi:alpha-galactosidase [Termitidicoccus mucosus]